MGQRGYDGLVEGFSFAAAGSPAGGALLYRSSLRPLSLRPPLAQRFGVPSATASDADRWREFASSRQPENRPLGDFQSCGDFAGGQKLGLCGCSTHRHTSLVEPIHRARCAAHDGRIHAADTLKRVTGDKRSENATSKVGTREKKLQDVTRCNVLQAGFVVVDAVNSRLVVQLPDVATVQFLLGGFRRTCQVFARMATDETQKLGPVPKQFPSADERT